MKAVNIFKLLVKIVAVIAIIPAVGLIAYACHGANQVRPFSEYDAYVIRPLNSDSERDVSWADYLYSHIANRVDKPGLITYVDEPFVDGPTLRVDISFDPDISTEYEMRYGHDRITLVGKRRATMYWLVYQFIALAGRGDPRIEISDLQPAMIDLVPGAHNFDFEYRGIYTLSNMNSDQMLMIASQNVDSDWGLWGHNLAKLFPNGIPEEAKAKVNGERTSEQVCLSSEALYQAIEKYIINNYGDSSEDFARFLIMPNDNALVCTCSQCREAGNDPESATPANTMLVTRLARRFPQHQFFMCAYMSTLAAPSEPLPPNAGVLISAIDLPMRHNPQGNEHFTTLLNAWRAATTRIYVWDYTNNFDDYLTPFPCTPLMAERLRYYKQLGVKGVFINGAAPLYSTLNFMATFTEASLMINTELDPYQLTEIYFRKNYPSTAHLFIEYYQKMMKRAQESDLGLSFYGGIGHAVQSYLDPNEFIAFYDKLEAEAKHTGGNERRQLNRLLTAMSFTRLELLRLSEKMYNPTNAAPFIENLNNRFAFPEMTAYREAEGDFDQYIAQWQALPEIAHIYSHNAIKGKKITANTDHLDPDYRNTEMLTDGLCGFPTDYHTNWLINSRRTLDLTLPEGTEGMGSQLIVSTMNAPRWRLAPPERVELWQSGSMIASTTPKVGEPFSRSLLTMPLSSARPGEKLVLKVIAPKGAKFAIDEVSVK